jgi:magnesium-transporting ATPase (P-type)
MFLNSNTSLSMYLFYNSIIYVITLYSGHVCVYYASMFRCWHLVWILVRTDHPYIGVGCHRVSEPYEYNMTLTAIFLKTYGEDTLQCMYKDYSSIERWQANRDLLSVFTFCNDAPTPR